jgi:hypothetical protein
VKTPPGHYLVSQQRPVAQITRQLFILLINVVVPNKKLYGLLAALPQTEDLRQDTTEHAAEKLDVLKGHDFSRAVTAQNQWGL